MLRIVSGKDEQPQEDAPEDVLYTMYVDIHNLDDSINNMSNLAASLRNTSAYMADNLSKWSQGRTQNYPPPQ